MSGMTYVMERLNDSVTPGMVSALDIGCGPGTYLHTLPQQISVRWALDVNAAELDKVEGAVRVRGSAVEMLPTFADASVDLVYALDFIEHLDKATGRIVLKEMQRIARQLVIVFTPHGFQVQDHGPDHPQTHRSGWFPEDFAAHNFVADCILFDYGKPPGKWAPAIWATWHP